MDVGQGWWILGLSQPGILSEDGLLFPANYALDSSFWKLLLLEAPTVQQKSQPSDSLWCPLNLGFPACHTGIGCSLGQCMASHLPLASAQASFYAKKVSGIWMQSCNGEQIYCLLVTAIPCPPGAPLPAAGAPGASPCLQGSGCACCSLPGPDGGCLLAPRKGEGEKEEGKQGGRE